MKHNRASLARLHDNIFPSVASLVDDFDRQCELAHERYAVGDYQQVVDLIFVEWTSAKEVFLMMTRCRQTALELATSLEKLKRRVEAEKVYRRIIAINPGSRDWVMHFAQLSVGNAEMEAGNWQAAMESFVIAYDSALPVPPDVEVRYEERTWQHFERLADALIAANKLQTALQRAKVRVAGDSSDPGWAVLAGILLERLSICEEALAYYESAYQQAPTAQFLKEHILDLEVGKDACQH